MQSSRRIISLVFLGCLFFLPAVAGAKNRSLSRSIDAAGIDILNLETGVGDTSVTTVPGGDTISVEVTLHPRRGGFFSSLEKGEKQVDAAVIDTSRSGKELKLRIKTGRAGNGGDRRFEETWKIRIPERLGLDIEMGVGDLEVTGVAGDSEIELGVGDAEILHRDGDLDISVGVGDVDLEFSPARVGEVSAASGVGGVELTDGDRHIEGKGSVGQSLEWKGGGKAEIELETGVGDINIRTLTPEKED